MSRSSPAQAPLTERPALAWTHVHPEVQAQLSRFHPEVVQEVADTVAREEWVLVGMATNTFVGRARKLLRQEGISFTELRYGGYTSSWKERLAIKLWAGFPTFPMVFRRGVLLGGASELRALQRAGTLRD
jgi:glutaredoxin-related protein